MSKGTKALLILGAIGGFLEAIILTPGVEDLLNPRNGGIRPIPSWIFDVIQLLGFILIGIGFLGLWRKSGNFIPLVSAIFIFLQTIGWLYVGLWVLYPWLRPDPSSPVPAIIAIIVGVAWFTAGISAWILREEFSRFAIVAALVFVITAAASLGVGLLFGINPSDFPDWFVWLMVLNSTVVGIFFLDAIRIET